MTNKLDKLSLNSFCDRKLILKEGPVHCGAALLYCELQAASFGILPTCFSPCGYRYTATSPLLEEQLSGAWREYHALGTDRAKFSPH